MSVTYFQEHILPIKDKLYRLAHRILKNTMEAEDVVQEVLLKIWQKRESWQEVQNIEALAMKMTKNLALDKFKSKHFQTNGLPDYVDWRDEAAQPDEITESSDLISLIRQIMNNLPEKHRSVMHLRDIEGLSYEEISEILEMPMSQLKINLFRARQSIRAQLIKRQIA